MHSTQPIVLLRNALCEVEGGDGVASSRRGDGRGQSLIRCGRLISCRRRSPISRLLTVMNFSLEQMCDEGE